MTKTNVNTMISHLKKADNVLTVTPWMFEEIRGEKVEARYLGLKLDQEWQEVFSSKNRMMLKFFLAQKRGFVEVLLANSTPFVRIEVFELHSSDKIDVLLGKLRHQLKEDKTALQHHRDSIENLYKKIVNSLVK